MNVDDADQKLILAFDWSRDGKLFAFASATLTSDVVRIREVGGR